LATDSLSHLSPNGSHGVSAVGLFQFVVPYDFLKYSNLWRKSTKKAIKISTFMPSFNMFFDMKEVNYHTMYVGKIEKVLVRDDEYLG
jgi:hypothetical protein